MFALNMSMLVLVKLSWQFLESGYREGGCDTNGSMGQERKTLAVNKLCAYMISFLLCLFFFLLLNLLLLKTCFCYSIMCSHSLEEDGLLLLPQSLPDDCKGRGTEWVRECAPLPSPPHPTINLLLQPRLIKVYLPDTSRKLPPPTNHPAHRLVQ